MESISFVLQKTFMFEGTIRDNISGGVTGATEEDILRAAHLAQCDDIIEKYGLDCCITGDANTLSGGEKQRIYLAMAFAQESELILLDEPTNHLDIGYQLSMMEVLRSFREKTVFTSVHDMNLAAWYCDRLLLLNHGKIIRVGTPEEVLTPELIRNVFHVNAAVNRRPEDGRIQISYLSYIRS